MTPPSFYQLNEGGYMSRHTVRIASILNTADIPYGFVDEPGYDPEFEIHERLFIQVSPYADKCFSVNHWNEEKTEMSHYLFHYHEIGEILNKVRELS